MKKTILIVAVFACFCQIFAGNGWQAGEFEVKDLTVENWGGSDACTGSISPGVRSLGYYEDYFYINISTNLGKQLLANLMLAKATGKKVAIQITNTNTNRPIITGVSVH